MVLGFQAPGIPGSQGHGVLCKSRVGVRVGPGRVRLAGPCPLIFGPINFKRVYRILKQKVDLFKSNSRKHVT